MEIVELDSAEQDVIKIEIIEKLPFLRIGLSYNFMEDALTVVNGIASSNQTRWLDNVTSAHKQLCDQLPQEVPNVAPYMQKSDLLWAYVCVLSFYLYADEDIWRKHVLPRMEGKLHHPRLRDEIQEAKKLINAEQEKYLSLIADINNLVRQTEPPALADTQSSAREAELKQLLAQKDAEIEKLKSRIKELEAQLNVVHLSFIQTEGKNPDVIKCVYIDLRKATVGPAEMAECLHDLKIRSLIKNQEPYKKLNNIKKIHKELQETYHFEWTYDALRRALSRKSTKK